MGPLQITETIIKSMRKVKMYVFGTIYCKHLQRLICSIKTLLFVGDLKRRPPVIILLQTHKRCVYKPQLVSITTQRFIAEICFQDE